MPDCVKCGETSWLLTKTETRSYYAVVSDECKWIELTKKKKQSPFKLMCGKCEQSADDVATMDYVVKERPLGVVWQTRIWKQFE